MSPRLPPRAARVLSAAITALGLLGTAQILAGAASAADEAPSYLRFAQFSPDAGTLTASAAVRGGSGAALESPVPVNTVTGYAAIPAGTYSIAFRSATAGTTLVSGDLELAPGEAATVAAIGPAGAIQNVVLDDDLDSPAAGRAAVRAVNVASITTPVDVEGAGRVLLSRGGLGDAGERAEVDPGPLSLALTSGGSTDVADVEVAPGTVVSIFVVADARAALSVIPVVDAVGVAEPPVGGVATGGGYLSSTGAGPILAAAVGAVALLIVARRLRPRRRSTQT